MLIFKVALLGNLMLHFIKAMIELLFQVLEVNGIYVQGKTLDQVTDMMVANAHNLIITGEWCFFLISCFVLSLVFTFD